MYFIFLFRKYGFLFNVMDKLFESLYFQLVDNAKAVKSFVQCSRVDANSRF